LTDRTTCVLFGDGAGAVVMGAQQQPGNRDDRGVLTTHLRSDGRHKSKLYVDGGPSSTKTVGFLRMEGRAVFKHAVAMITDVIEDAFRTTGYTAADIDWSCRTRPTSASSTIPPTSLASRRRRW
jgi:3-oxoacyl-[acyl-carrier-protein] synthase-3